MFEVTWRDICDPDYAVYAAVLPEERVSPESYSDDEVQPRVKVSTSNGGFNWDPPADATGITVRGREYAFEHVYRLEPSGSLRLDTQMYVIRCYRKDDGKWVECAVPATLRAVIDRIETEIAKDADQIRKISKGLALEKEITRHHVRLLELHDEAGSTIEALGRTYAQRDNLIREINGR